MNKVESIKNNKFFVKWDIVVYLIVLAVAIVAVVIALKPSGETVEVRVEGELIYSGSLSVDKEIEIDGVGKVIIYNNSVCIIESTCTEHLCEAQGYISRAGERIICLPNKLVISISGESEFDVMV